MNKPASLRFIVYAAGVASRMNADKTRGLKAMMQVDGRRLIEFQLDWIARHAREIVIVIGLEHDLLREHIGDEYRGVPVKWVLNPDYKTKGNMLSLWAAREFCDSDTLFTVSDLICDLDNIDAFMAAPQKTKILVDPLPTRFGDDDPVKVKIDNGRITRILKKMPREQIAGCAVGVYQLSAKAIGALIAEIDASIKRGDDNKSLYYAINDALDADFYSPVFCRNESWFDVDTPEDLSKANARLHGGLMRVSQKSTSIRHGSI